MTASSVCSDALTPKAFFTNGVPLAGGERVNAVPRLGLQNIKAVVMLQGCLHPLMA
jgi:hypothetical protein